MKTLKNYLFVASVSLMVAACSNEMKDVVDTPVTLVAVQTTDGSLKYMEFTASTGADTRTQLTDDNKVVWVSGDAISIFDGTANRQFTTKDNGASAVFGGEAKSVETYYALYPYQAGATIENNVIKNVSIPVVQEAKAGSFDGGVNLSVASASTDLQLAFKNVGSLVKFAMNNDKATDVRSVKLTSNDGTAILAGSVNITVGATPTVTATNSQSQVTLKSDTGFEKDKDYYFMVLPGTLSEGFSLTFTDKDNLTWQKSYTAEATMNRSNILRLNDIELGTFTTGLLTNVNLIAAAEASSGQSFTKNADGTVSLLNSTNLQIVQSITRLDLSGKGDPTICEEIGLFRNLRSLSCSNNGITSLDLSKNTALTTLECSYNQLKSLDLTKNTTLTRLDIHYNQLTSLDITKQMDLEVICCDNNQLTSLDITNNTVLTSLLCDENQLTSLDLTNNAALKHLSCNNNQLTSLYLAKNTALINIECAWNQLTSLDLTKNTALIRLRCDWNQLTSLNLTNNPALTGVWCHHNQLASLDISNNNQIEWENLYVGSQTDVSNNDQVINLYVNADQLSQTLPDIEVSNMNVNILLKSDATHEGYNEVGY